MKNLILLLLAFLSTCVCAQTIDSTFMLAYPFQKKIAQIGRVQGVSISILQVTKDGSKTSYCRISTEGGVDGGFGTTAYIGDNQFTTILTRGETEYFAKRLNELYVLAGEDKSTVYVEYVDLIRSATGNLEISMFSGGGGEAFTIQLDTDRYLNRGRTQMKLEKLPELAGLIKRCLEMMKP